MNQINEYIESNKKILEERIKVLKETFDEDEIRHQRLNIERIRYYIMGLEDAKKYILEEEKENEKN